MNRGLLAILTALLLAAQVHAQQQVTVSAYGWTVTADTVQSTLTVAHERLGPVLRNVRLARRGTEAVTGWAAERSGQDQLLIRSSQPMMAWRIEPGPDTLTISSTSYDAQLTATAPAPLTRIPARLIDREGTPVVWFGNNEVKGTYGADVPGVPSFLPRNNPEVMYFSLGQVSNPLLHSLFDRSTGIAIDFPLHTRMLRNPADADEVAVTIPVEDSALVRLYPDYFTKILGFPFYIPFNDTYFPSAPMVWSSWTSYYEAVTEADIVRNTDWLAENLRPYGFQYVQLDDGYDRDETGQHYWIQNWDRRKFPHGPQWLTSYIKLRPRNGTRVAACCGQTPCGLQPAQNTAALLADALPPSTARAPSPPPWRKTRISSRNTSREVDGLCGCSRYVCHHGRKGCAYCVNMKKTGL